MHLRECPMLLTQAGLVSIINSNIESIGFVDIQAQFHHAVKTELFRTSRKCHLGTHHTF